MEKIRIALANRVAGTAPVFSAVEGGYFKDNGLETELIDYPGHGSSLPALVAGEVDFTNAVSPELITVNTRQDGDAVIIASAISRSAQQVSARPGLSSLEELRGKRWGIMARGDADECSIAMAFERWGWDVKKDAEIVVVGPGKARLDCLLDETKVDAAIMHAPEPFWARQRGWNLVDDLGHMGIPFQNSCAATTRRLIKEKRDIALRYVRAYCQGVYRFRTDPAFGIHVLEKWCGEKDRAILKITYVMYARFMDGMMFPTLEGLRNACRMLHRVGVLDRLPEPEEFADMGPIVELEKEGFFETMMGLGE